VTSQTASSGPVPGDRLESAARARGPLALEALSLSKDFRLGRGQTLHAVREVSLSLYRAAVVALVGESGSGKSTVARLLAGQEQPTAGEIKLAGTAVHLGSRKAFRRYKSEVQLVFQDPFASLNPAHTVGYHLERPLRLHRNLTSGEQTRQAALGLLEQVRLQPASQYLGKYPHQLSGGQRQRVAFARALAAEPTVLLADEPVSMLDVSIRLEMLSLLDDLRQRFSLAMLYITHDIASARYFADEVLVMYAGQIVERGPAEQVTQTPAHPYTQLLVSSAPDPDNLGAGLREVATARRVAAAGRHPMPGGGLPRADLRRPPPVPAPLAAGARWPTTGAAMPSPRWCRSRRPGPRPASGSTSPLPPLSSQHRGVGTLRTNSKTRLAGSLLVTAYRKG
jgi:peptide/nickel transport system ATP-binding protein